MITILKNTLIIYVGLLGLSTIGSLFICLDQDYHQQCPSHVITILSDLSVIPIVNEARMMLIPMIKELPPQWITVLIWSSLMMTTALIISVMYLTAKFTYNVLMNLVKFIVILMLISLVYAWWMNAQDIPQKLQYYLKYLQLFQQ
ncbi:unnamed protein product (macronuclear) [Paramecium tetraurelia]|uniref:Uncharacterized protein n=1 Tax=Paramecium tetraurelia TaxID=5888 RepID=A0CTA1_PARTE|nr:uncharacterized protein GSPATT00010252001 [Paramecium tetraurelia]CAK74018.1 unnamed protein product [Paramecium tetraurelia]|eukprot:XP_001441415.1 hypothetical protein (macronuclear) [Paramecium tetraurelia strain d4-2]